MKAHRSVLIVAAICLAGAPGALAQESKSAEHAVRLTRLLEERKLEAMAARDADEPERFVAALHIPGSQLLVVSAIYPAPAVLEQRIAQRSYRDAYLDLYGAGTREGRFFVTDLQANGLRRVRESGQPFDVTYTDGAEEMMYDGNWRAQRRTEAQYNARFEREDARYARMLRTLIAALEQPLTRREPAAGSEEGVPRRARNGRP